MPCSRVTLGLLLAIVLLWLSRHAGVFDLRSALALEPPSLWRGQLWRPLTAPLVATDFPNLLVTGLALLWFAAGLESRWRPHEWLSYAFLCASAAGLAAALLFPRTSLISAGPALLVMALLVAQARLARGESFHFSATFSLPAPAVYLAFAVIAVAGALVTGYPLPGLVALALSGVAGWIYLSLRWRWLDRSPAVALESRRGRHLEL